MKPHRRPTSARLGVVALALAMPAAGSGQTGTPPEPGQRVVLITGSTNGLGREVARSLAERGDHVIVHGRSEERGLALVEEIVAGTSGSARFYAADFASLDAVRGLADAIVRDYPRLDVLVNNAGILPGDTRRESAEGYELAFQVNYLAGYLLTEELLPLLRASAPARIVNVSSRAAAPLDFDDLMLERRYSGGRAYGQSKLAQVMFTIDLAAELEGSGVTVNALHPASMMDTNMILARGMRPRSTVEEGRDNVLQLIDGQGVGSGEYYVDGRPVRAFDSQAYDPEARRRLREATERLIAR